jgi:RNA polymerase sigma-70 factor (ECF subfamily)
VARFASAWESADIGALVALLTDDVFVSMPPMPFEYRGRDAAARFSAAIFGAGRRFDLVRPGPTASPRSGPTWGGRAASGTEPACTSWRWPATGSAP